MRICVNSAYPGGVDGSLANAFEDGELLDYYLVRDDGTIEHEAQMRRCMGGCAGPAESVVRRGVEKIVVKSISSGSLLTLRLGGVKVYFSSSSSVKDSIQMLLNGSLHEADFSERTSNSQKR